jgi:hypothetical protein
MYKLLCATKFDTKINYNKNTIFIPKSRQKKNSNNQKVYKNINLCVEYNKKKMGKHFHATESFHIIFYNLFGGRMFMKFVYHLI